ncbi:MAG: phage integrase SAM-like domain-containing protein, partial [Parabacteroides sp.]
KNKLDGFINRILKICQVTEEKDKSLLSKNWIEQSLLATKNMSADNITYSILCEFWENPSMNETDKSFFGLFDLYLENVKFSNVREKNFRVLERALRRYELFIQGTKCKKFKIEIDSIDKDFIEDFESYLRNEYTLVKEMPTIFSNFPVNTDTGRSHRPSQRGNNTICALFNKFKAFYHWCNEQGITKNHPFSGCKIKSEKYGTPYYLTIEERNQIADFDLSDHKELEIQRDIFIFQCCIGCRVSDLMKMTGESVINEAIEYIPHKTKDERPAVVRVPLNSRAKILVNKYMNGKKDSLFPFVSSQSYNEDIKRIFKICGITRMVTILNSVTGEEEKVPINEVASSHMARRTFIGNLYKKIKDPNLICPLSGHTNGSKAFARYREIDEDMKKEIVSLID